MTGSQQRTSMKSWSIPGSGRDSTLEAARRTPVKPIGPDAATDRHCSNRSIEAGSVETVFSTSIPRSAKKRADVGGNLCGHWGSQWRR